MDGGRSNLLHIRLILATFRAKSPLSAKEHLHPKPTITLLFQALLEQDFGQTKTRKARWLFACNQRTGKGDNYPLSQLERVCGIRAVESTLRNSQHWLGALLGECYVYGIVDQETMELVRQEAYKDFTLV